MPSTEQSIFAPEGEPPSRIDELVHHAAIYYGVNPESSEEVIGIRANMSEAINNGYFEQAGDFRDQVIELTSGSRILAAVVPEAAMIIDFHPNGDNVRNAGGANDVSRQKLESVVKLLNGSGSSRYLPSR